MDPMTWLAALVAGVAVGTLTGLLPGIHVNTIAAIALAVPGASPSWAVALLAVGTTHAFIQVLPATYLGAPSDESQLGALPGHRMLHRGQGREAVRVALDSSLVGLLLALAAAPLAATILTVPPVQSWAERAAVPVLAATLLVLLWLESRRGLRSLRWGAAVLAASGALGLIAMRLPLQALVPVPASPFLPMLSGLFGVAGLLASLSSGGKAPPQDAPRLAGRIPRDQRLPAGLGVLASFGTLAIPGLTSASAAAWATLGRRDGETSQVALMSSINTAHLALATVLVGTTGQARTGLAQGVAAWTHDASTWGFVPHRGLASLLLAVLASALLAWTLTHRLDAAYVRVVHSWRPRLVASVAVLLLVGLTAVLSGWLGLAVLAASTALGLVPLAAGVRRIHLTGALLIPALASRLP